MDLPTLCLLVIILGGLVAAQEVCIVPKCCPLNQSISGYSMNCHNSSLTFEPVFWNGSETIVGDDSDPLNVIVGDPCPSDKIRLEPHIYSNDEFHIFCNGTLLAPFQRTLLYNMSEYCLETFLLPGGGEEAVVLPLICTPNLPPPTLMEKLALVVYPVGLLISVPFLIVTIVVFLGIPELRDTQGKSLSCHCFSLAVAFLLLATLELIGEKFSLSSCIMLAFVVQFSFVSCFFWLNVMCIDTWWRLTQKPCWSSRQERIHFLWYSLYAWSVPLAFVIVTIHLELTPMVPNAYLKPNVLRWFYIGNPDSKVCFPYFNGTIGLLLLINIVLLWMSVGAVRAAVDQREEEEMNLNVERNTCPYNDAYRRIELFRQSLILLVVMGFNWMLELVSHFVGGPIEMWLLTDLLNTLQGVIIYFIFIVSAPRVKYLASTRLLHTLRRT